MNQMSAVDSEQDHGPKTEKITTSFLHLPAELRMQVYDLALTPPTPTSLPPASGLLGVCRLLYHEACPIMYSRSVFLLHDRLLSHMPRPYAAPTFALPRLSAIARQSICRWRLRVRLDCGPLFSPQAAAEQLSGCAELSVDAWTAAFGVTGCRNLVRGLSLVRGVSACRVTGCVRGRGDGDEDAADQVERRCALPLGQAVEFVYDDSDVEVDQVLREATRRGAVDGDDDNDDNSDDANDHDGNP